jgi:hypothetical protein
MCVRIGWLAVCVSLACGGDKSRATEPAPTPADEAATEVPHGTIDFVPPAEVVRVGPGMWMAEGGVINVMASETEEGVYAATDAFRTPDRLASQLRVRRRTIEEATIDGFPGLILNGDSLKDEGWRKWVAVFGDDQTSGWLTVNYRAELEDTFSQAIRSSLRTIRWNHSPYRNPLAGLAIAADGLTVDHVRFPGSSVELRLPAGYMPIGVQPGFGPLDRFAPIIAMDRDESYAISSSIMLYPGPENAMMEVIAIDEEDVKLGEHTGMLVRGQRFDIEDRLAWLGLVTGSWNGAALVYASFLADAPAAQLDLLRASLLTARWTKDDRIADDRTVYGARIGEPETVILRVDARGAVSRWLRSRWQALSNAAVQGQLRSSAKHRPSDVLIVYVDPEAPAVATTGVLAPAHRLKLHVTEKAVRCVTAHLDVRGQVTIGNEAIANAQVYTRFVDIGRSGAQLFIEIEEGVSDWAHARLDHAAWRAGWKSRHW